MSEKFTGHGIVGPMGGPGPADFYGPWHRQKYPRPKYRLPFGFENRFLSIFKAEVREKAAFPKRRPQRRRFGGDAAENRKFERGNVALLGTKNFQHFMFNEMFKFLN